MINLFIIGMVILLNDIPLAFLFYKWYRKTKGVGDATCLLPSKQWVIERLTIILKRESCGSITAYIIANNTARWYENKATGSERAILIRYIQNVLFE